MTPQTLTLLIAFAAAVVAMNNRLPTLRDGYRCGGCGTQKRGKHTEGCQWKEND